VRASLDPDNSPRWLARADRWEKLAEAEIQECYRECNASSDDLAA
jgi:hypothetical protein